MWKFYLDNEQLLKEVQDIASENNAALKRIYNIENYYESSLLPKLLSFPKQYLNRIKMVKQQQAQQERKIEQIRMQMLEQQNQQLLNHTDTIQAPVCTCNDSKQEDVVTQPQDDQKKKEKIRKKHMRRTAKEINRNFICPYDGCGKVYGSEGSLNLHIKIKHNGGNKTDREKLAMTLVSAHLNGTITSQIDMVDLNLPPGTLTKAARKQGLGDEMQESELLKQVQLKLLKKQNDTVKRLKTK